MLELHYLLLFCMIICRGFTASRELDTCGGSVMTGLPCSQLCHHEDDARVACYCHPGYILADDGRTCSVLGPEPVLVYTTDTSIHVYNVESEINRTLVKQGTRVTDMTVGPGDTLYWTDAGTNSVYKTALYGSPVQEPEAVIDTGLQSVDGIAVDWVTGNVYIVDRKARTIIVCSSAGDNCVSLIKNLDNPNDIVVNMESRSIIWSQLGNSSNTGSINTSSMDGTQNRCLLKNLQRPSDLIYDVTINALYWLEKDDVSDHMIKVVRLDDLEQIKEITKIKDFSTPSISILADTLYIAESSHVLLMNKFTGNVTSRNDMMTSRSITLEGRQITRAFMYHPVLYSTDKENECANAVCSHVCVPGNVEAGYKCVCPADMNKSGSQCQYNGAEMLLVSTMTGIYGVPLYYIGQSSQRAKLLYSGDVDVIAHEPYRGQFVFHDAGDRSLKFMDIGRPQQAVTLYSNFPQIEGIAVDVTSGNIYWTTNTGRVYVGKQDGTLSMVIVSGLEKPRGITLDITSGYMYICDWGRDARILQCQMDGSICTTFIDIPGGHPNMIVMETRARDYDVITNSVGDFGVKKTLYWTDSKLDKISIQSVSDTNLLGDIQTDILLNSSSPHPYALTVTRDRIFYTDLNSGHLHYAYKTQLNVVRNISLQLGAVYGLQNVENVDTGRVVPMTKCSMKNGGCSHLCLVKPDFSRTCLCPDNLTLANDLQTCTHSGFVATASPEPELITITPASQTPPDKSNHQAGSQERTDYTSLIIILVTGSSVAILATVAIVVCCRIYKRQKRGWMFRLVRYVKAHANDDDEKLVTDADMDVKADHEDDVCIRHNWHAEGARETSMVSMDSAFTEMKDFETYCSIDNLCQ